MRKPITAGATDQTIDIFIPDSSSTTGGGLTGLVFNSSGLTCYYRKGATGTATALTLATQTVGGAHSDGGFVEVDATNMPGIYRLDLSDTMVSSAGNSTIYLQGATNMAPVMIEQPVGFDVQVSTNNDKTGYSISGTKTTLDALNDITTADVNGEVVDVVSTDTQALPGQGAPTATPTFVEAVMYLYKAFRNKHTIDTSGNYKLFADDAITVDQKRAVTDDDTTFETGEMVTGP